MRVDPWVLNDVPPNPRRSERTTPRNNLGCEGSHLAPVDFKNSTKTPQDGTSGISGQCGGSRLALDTSESAAAFASHDACGQERNNLRCDGFRLAQGNVLGSLISDRAVAHASHWRGRRGQFRSPGQVASAPDSEGDETSEVREQCGGSRLALDGNEGAAAHALHTTRRALVLVERAVFKGRQQNTVSYNTAIGACEKGKRRQQDLDPSVNMPGESAQQDTITYSAAISAREKGKKWQRTLELFENMPGKSMQQEAITYSSAISACEKSENKMTTSRKDNWLSNRYIRLLPGVTAQQAIETVEYQNEPEHESSHLVFPSLRERNRTRVMVQLALDLDFTLGSKIYPSV